MVVLLNDPSGKAVVGWIRASRDAQRAANDGLRGDNLVEGAVRAQLLTQLLDHIEKARETLKKIESAPRDLNTAG